MQHLFALSTLNFIEIPASVPQLFIFLLNAVTKVWTIDPSIDPAFIE